MNGYLKFNGKRREINAMKIACGSDNSYRIDTKNM